jgi:hypothetical protein
VCFKHRRTKVRRGLCKQDKAVMQLERQRVKEAIRVSIRRRTASLLRLKSMFRARKESRNINKVGRSYDQVSGLSHCRFSNGQPPDWYRTNITPYPIVQIMMTCFRGDRPRDQERAHLSFAMPAHDWRRNQDLKVETDLVSSFALPLPLDSSSFVRAWSGRFALACSRS